MRCRSMRHRNSAVRSINSTRLIKRTRRLRTSTACRRSVSTLCFVLMPMRDEFIELYKNVIKAAAEERAL